ncbi:MAG: SIS domain-containing protein [Chlorobi bacterium]|nr:SIS domain-containing protein [Chlorobiota bacterium]
MDPNNHTYSQYALVREMLETADVVRKFDPQCSARFAETVEKKQKLFLTGEGSSRIFPAKRAIYHAMKEAFPYPVTTEGATQALEYALDEYAVFGASNSGKTKEVIRLFKSLKESRHQAFYGLTANENTPLEELALETHILQCGKEDAVAATKSVIEQGLFYDSLFHHLQNKKMTGLKELADHLELAMKADVDPAIVYMLKNADVLYFAGRNTGVAEELTLKTNEITRKKSDFLEGTYALHGIEEVMDKNEVVVIIDPFESEEEKFQTCLADGVGMKIVAISSRQTRFPTLVINSENLYKEYIELAAGWNLLVETGIALGINLDKPVRARKVGNEFTTD